MMSLYSYTDYRKFLADYLSELPNRGYGHLTKLAEACGAHPTLLSLILKGNRDFSSEQAYRVSVYLNMSNHETDYFALLVQYSRAGDHKFKNHLYEKIHKIQIDSKKIKNRFKHDLVLDEQSKQIFYSSYMFSAIRLFCDTEKGGVSLQQLMQKFRIDRLELVSKLDFLTKAGLLIENKGFYKMGAARTLVDRDSVYVIKHHQNWRLQALLKAEKLQTDELMFTCPMVLSEEDFKKFKTELTDLIQKFSNKLVDSKSEITGCFNIDWFKF
ncbi:MAG: TIGR02147 family protein [Bdellovibrionales bacterium]